MNDEAENNEQPANSDETPTLGWSIGRNALMLGGFALACTTVIALTYLSTAEDIAERVKEARLRALLEIVPRTQHDNQLLNDNIPFYDETLGHRQPGQLFLARQQGQDVALIYPATARDGYSGDIDYIVGVNLTDNSIAGLRVLRHKETPGLGDKIELRKSDWVLSFNGKSLQNLPAKQWAVSKDGGTFDAFTGATITPRAVVNSVSEVLRYHEQHAEKLLVELHTARTTETGQQ